MPRARPAPHPAPPVTVHRAPEHLARRFQQVCSSLQAPLFAEHGLASWQYALIVQLRTTPGADCAGLAAGIGRDATSTGQALDMLVERGWVSRSVAPRDRRAWSFALTPAGLAFHEAMRPQATAASRRITAPLSPAEAETLLDLLTRIVVAHEEHAHPGAGRRPPRPRNQARAEGEPSCTVSVPSPAERRFTSGSAASLAAGASPRSRNPRRQG